MTEWNIPCEWSMYGIQKIEAETLEDAIRILDETEDVLPLPDNGEYVDGSFKRDGDLDYIEFFNQ